ncbi:hypothetical protein [Novosphingopyxis sp. YJ-S2-01]|uniref:hypothetical protein n=1 Tax=Novosphingopyxis sp. YJ-S2-01 TaxID=2794021 RepID=UPI0018DCDB3F|nr:hypothetical protein [Novosphingopyxis sp. YJ-S2-01]MBH9538052.1 hypothetical protein [Novosphingopyxis sp. YJ-S2-01]
MKSWSEMYYNDRLALCMFAFFGLGWFGSAAVLDWFYGRDLLIQLLFSLFWAFAWLCGAIVAIAALVLGDARPAQAQRRWLSRSLPLLSLMGTALLLWGISSLISDRARLSFAEANNHVLEGPPPKAAIYSQGIPDGGTAIIRSPGRDPESFDGNTSYQLVGGNIRSCERMNARDWFCIFG